MRADAYIDETLEAVALVLRDLKTDFEEKLSRIATDGDAQRESCLSKLTEAAHIADEIQARAASDRQELNARLEELQQQAAAFADRQREENKGRITTLNTTLESLQKKIAEVEKVGHGAVDMVRATQESMLRLAEEAKQALEPLAASIDDVRARHQTVLSQLAEVDAKVVLRSELEELIRTSVIGETQKGFRAFTLSELAEKLDEQKTALEEKSSTLAGLFEELQKFEQKKRDLLQQEFVQTLEGLTEKKDLEAVQELLEEINARTTDAIDFSEKTAAEMEQALQKQWTQTETAVEALRNAFSERQEESWAQMSEVQETFSKNLITEVRASITARSKESNRLLLRQAEQFIIKLSENIKGERGPAGQVSRVQQWVADYQFRELALVRHRAGLWQANCDTSEEPRGDCEDWNLVAAGIRSVTVSPDETPGSYRLLALDSADLVHTTEFHVPLPTFYKIWDAKHEYRHYDSVMEDGHRWLAVKDAPTGPPSRSEDWVLLGMRGGRGARGMKGDPGPIGHTPDMEEILDAYDQRRLNANGTPVSSFRGTWRFGADYVVGDFVRGPGVMALCREDHRAENPPTSMNAQWEILFNLPDPGSEGGPRPQDLQAQITALTAQIQALTGAG